MDYILHNYLGLDGVQSQTLSKLIDRMHKIQHAEFVAEVDSMFTPTQKESGVSEKLMDLLATKDLSELPVQVKDSPASAELTHLFELLEASGILNARFDITIMRGFDYYTGIVFELVDTDPENNRSMMGGGRYNGLVGLFGVEPVPTVGFGWGDVTLINFLESHELMPKLPPETEVYAILVGDVYKQSQKLLKTLRDENLRVAVDASDRKPANKLKSALKNNIRYALFIGEKEAPKEGQYNLKDLQKNKEVTLSPERIVSSILDERNKSNLEI